jgi:hypothetical protein
MSLLAMLVPSSESNQETGNNEGEDALIGELYDVARGSLPLLMIYKKMEIAAEVGDYSLMNEIYVEFKMTQASLN